MKVSRRRSLKLLGAAGASVAFRPYRLFAGSGLTVRAAPVMGTIAEVFVRHEDSRFAARAAEAALETLRTVDCNLSHYSAGSDPGRLAGARGGWTGVSDDFVRVMDISREVHALTGGLFDPSLGAVIRLWKEAARTGREPDLHLAKSLPFGLDGVELDRMNGRARLLDQRLRLDFGAIGKGYGADRAGETLRAMGIETALVAVSGDIRVVGKMPVDEIAIQHPDYPDRSLASIVLEDAAVSTSGDYEQGLQFGAARRSHQIDPRTNSPVVPPLRSVSVIARSGVMADALSTSVFLLGEQKGFSFAYDRADALIAGEFSLAATPGFMRRMVREASL